MYSYPFLEFFHKIAATDSLNLISYSSDVSISDLEPSIDIENKMSNVKVKIPCINGGMSLKLNFASPVYLKNNQLYLKESVNDVTLKEAYKSLDTADMNDVLKINDDDFKNFNPENIGKIPENLPAYQVINTCLLYNCCMLE